MIQNENTDLEFKQIKTYKKLSKKLKQKIETFFKSIIYFECRGVVYDLKTTKFEIKSFTNKYWKPRHVGKKTNYALYVNGEKILAKELFVLIYKCTVCSCENTIKNYSRLMPKLFKSTILYCRHCILKYDITMKYVRSTALTNNGLGAKFAKAKTHKEKQAFENMPKWWKDDYWKTHFTEDEFWKKH